MNPSHVAIIGSGFSGSLLGWILASQGVQVSLIDAQTHPRFAIGESSTPIADTLLRRLGETYQLKPLVDLSTYGSWKKTHPKITCGKKRGFSYYHHEAGQPFAEDHLGKRSLLVAASQSDSKADTHWYRSEVDEYFFKQAILSGVQPYSATSIVDIASVGDQCRLLCGGNYTGELIADYVIDATGRAAITAKLLGQPNLRDQLKTQTATSFAHYRGVRPWRDYLQAHGFDTSNDPFNPDDAAQHHLLGNTWTWMLRFDNDITSIGFCSPRGQVNDFASTSAYHWMMQDAVQVYPDDQSLIPSGQSLITEPWIQSYHEPIVADRVWMMPTAAITMDPLHSTGIAHGLAGVERLATMLLNPDGNAPARYAEILHQEVSLLDRLISTAYTVANDPARFNAACMVYFAAAITCEEQLKAGQNPSHLYNAGEDAFRTAVRNACGIISDLGEPRFESLVRTEIAPWNTAGLMSSGHQNRYAYTATKG
ncbi:Tryptophan halogenase [Rubripirellula amarantea]|uniref:Tryptophan halogenase n=1 Tax=Rubripirellula amarantea TaxID=2527999 RepID=A0A5C5WX11_9BACT|nr:NAD(P)/FAD-dependent oxidoreductase [Rubripirellula amarantea]TWT54779.1 Tryptophan halogenase [Rubripirellula amarantea]